MALQNKLGKTRLFFQWKDSNSQCSIISSHLRCIRLEPSLFVGVSHRSNVIDNDIRQKVNLYDLEMVEPNLERCLRKIMIPICDLKGARKWKQFVNFKHQMFAVAKFSQLLRRSKLAASVLNWSYLYGNGRMFLVLLINNKDAMCPVMLPAYLPLSFDCSGGERAKLCLCGMADSCLIIGSQKALLGNYWNYSRVFHSQMSVPGSQPPHPTHPVTAARLVDF